LNSSLIKRVDEKFLNDFEKQVEILFETSENGVKRQETITLSGEGSIKVLLPVLSLRRVPAFLINYQKRRGQL